EALEILDAELGVGSGGLAAEVSARIAADLDLQTQIDDLFADEIQHDGSGTNYMVGQADVDAALTVLDAQIFTNAGLIATNITDISTLQAEVTAHKDTDDPAHDGSVIEFTSNTGEPLISTDVEAAINEFHAAFLLGGVEIAGLEFDQTQIATSPADRATDPEAFIFFVDAVTGDDADNGGGEFDDAFKTINRALDEIGGLVMYPVTINIAAGAYTENIMINKKVVDQGFILLKGTGANPGSVTIDPGSSITQPKGTKGTLSTSGAYTWPFEEIYTVEIDSELGGPGGVDTFTWYRGPLEVATGVPIENVGGVMDLERGINISWSTDVGHSVDDFFTFKVHPQKGDILDINNTVRVHLDNFTVQNAFADGIRIANGSKVVANRINAESCWFNGIRVTDHSTLVMQTYDLSLNGGAAGSAPPNADNNNGLLVTKNSHAQIADGSSNGGGNGNGAVGYGIHADWNSGINTCDAVPGGDTAPTYARAGRFAFIETSDCWTTTTTTTSSTSTSTTSTTTTTTTT
ncbi:MAG: hypothetical protein KAR39_11675, partial [Thermoplasmata archaeon]|nr:hypothetical protein [Thermoplasmata archaeon]